jgi:hypothetical protein
MKTGMFWVLLAAQAALGQTKLDLKTQSKDVDFSGAASVKPFPAGLALPAICQPGNMFFETNAPAGANVFGCVATNTWAAESSGGTVPLAIQVSSNVLTIGAGCAQSSICVARLGPVAYAFIAPTTITLNSGSGLVFFYLDKNGNLTAGESSATSPGLTCSGCQVVSPVLQFPPDSLPLGSWNASAAAWDPTGIDSRAVLSAGRSFTAGPNITISQSGGNVAISASLTTLTSGTQPGCASGTRGSVWYTPGTTGVKDLVQVCAKDAANGYAWRTLY